MVRIQTHYLYIDIDLLFAMSYFITHYDINILNDVHANGNDWLTASFTNVNE